MGEMKIHAGKFYSSKIMLNPSTLPVRHDELRVCTKEKSFIIIIIILFTSSPYVNTTCTLPQVLYGAIMGTLTLSHTNTHTRVTTATHTHRPCPTAGLSRAGRLSDTSEATAGSKRRRVVQSGAERYRAAFLVNTAAARPAVSQPAAT